MIYNSCYPSEALRTNIPKIAENQRHTLKSVAEGAGVTYRTLRYFLDGERDMTILVADKIATFLGYTLVGLIQWRAK